MLTDSCVSFAPYFEIPEDRMDDFRALVDRFVEATRSEPGCLYYGFAFNGNQAICREGYADGDAMLAHLGNVGSLFEQAQQMTHVFRMELTGPEAELAKLRGPMGELDITWLTLETGFRN